MKNNKIILLRTHTVLVDLVPVLSKVAGVSFNNKTHKFFYAQHKGDIKITQRIMWVYPDIVARCRSIL